MLFYLFIYLLTVLQKNEFGTGLKWGNPNPALTSSDG